MPLTLTVMFVLVPGDSTPPAEERLNQPAAFVTAQLRLPIPVLVTAYTCEAGRNGPPTEPVELRPAPGIAERMPTPCTTNCTLLPE